MDLGSSMVQDKASAYLTQLEPRSAMMLRLASDSGSRVKWFMSQTELQIRCWALGQTWALVQLCRAVSGHSQLDLRSSNPTDVSVLKLRKQWAKCLARKKRKKLQAPSSKL